MRILVEERFMVPDDESKRALRQIARDTDSSYARVAQCDKQLGQTIGELLENDPEFVALRRRSRSSPIGGAELIDESVEGELILAVAKEVGQRFRKADPTTKAHWLLTLLESAQRDTEELARTCFERLPAVERRRFLEATAQDRMDPRTKPGSKRKTKGGDPSESLLGATPTHGASRRADQVEPRSRSQVKPSPAHETAPR